jgi:hypothetical protein
MSLLPTVEVVTARASLDTEKARSKQRTAAPA